MTHHSERDVLKGLAASAETLPPVLLPTTGRSGPSPERRDATRDLIDAVLRHSRIVTLAVLAGRSDVAADLGVARETVLKRLAAAGFADETNRLAAYTNFIRTLFSDSNVLRGSNVLAPDTLCIILEEDASTDVDTQTEPSFLSAAPPETSAQAVALANEVLAAFEGNVDAAHALGHALIALTDQGQAGSMQVNTNGVE